tara:strand:- start:269 stop:547 length:279 start_codon:yes stop_codon:yes gene_type:complete
MIIINSYEILNETVESKFNVTVNNKNYCLIIPSNPIADIDILKLHQLDIKNTIIQLKNIINNKLYSDKTLEKLNDFNKWLYKNFFSFNEISI